MNSGSRTANCAKEHRTRDRAYRACRRVAGGRDLLSLAADLHCALVGVVEVEVRLFSPMAVPISIRVLGRVSVSRSSKTEKSLLRIRSRPDPKDRPVRAVGIRIPGLNPVSLEEYSKIVAEVGGHCIVEAIADESLQLPLETIFRLTGRILGKSEPLMDRKNKVEGVPGELGSVTGQILFAKAL